MSCYDTAAAITTTNYYQTTMHAETYTLPPTPYVPNSPLPVLVYRNALPTPVTETSTQRFIEGNGWERQVCKPPSIVLCLQRIDASQGPVFPAIPKRHFHPNVHECYGIPGLFITSAQSVTLGRASAEKVSSAAPPKSTSAWEPATATTTTILQLDSV